MTLVEVLVVLGVIAVLLVLLLPIGGGPPRPTANVHCLSNLKQTAIGFFMWTENHDGRFPWQVSVTNGGSMEFVARGCAFPHFQTLSSFFKQPECFICPTDKAKRAAKDYADLSDQNISYFLNLDVSTNRPSAAILLGDRNLQANAQPAKPGLFILSTNLDMGWTGDLHAWRGCLAFADGHVEFVRNTNLNAKVRSQDLVSSRLAVP
jgi:hypothetical protein